MSNPTTNSTNFADWAAEIREQESTGNYGSHTTTHFGAYQMGNSALQAAGFQDKAGGWTAMARAYGVKSMQEFLAKPQAQDVAFERYTVSQYNDLVHYRGYVGQTIDGIKITLPGMLAGAHLVGPGGLILFLISNGRIVPTDKSEHPVPVTKYIKKYNGPSFHYDQKTNSFLNGSDISSAGDENSPGYRTPASIHAAIGAAGFHSVAPIQRQKFGKRTLLVDRRQPGSSSRPSFGYRISQQPSSSLVTGRRATEDVVDGAKGSFHAAVGRRLPGRASPDARPAAILASMKSSWQQAFGTARHVPYLVSEETMRSHHVMGSPATRHRENDAGSGSVAYGRVFRTKAEPTNREGHDVLPSFAPLGRIIRRAGALSEAQFDQDARNLSHNGDAAHMNNRHTVRSGQTNDRHRVAPELRPSARDEDAQLTRALREFFDREARLPPSGATGFDPRLTPAWAGQMMMG